jgi:hypothetical protein
VMHDMHQQQQPPRCVDPVTIDARRHKRIGDISAVLFSHNKPDTSNQSAVLFSQNESAPAVSPNRLGRWISPTPILDFQHRPDPVGTGLLLRLRIQPGQKEARPASTRRAVLI